MSIKREMAKSATWTVAMRLANRGIGFLSTLILARLLVPADFGLVAMAMVFVDLIELINAYSFQVFLVQKKDLTNQDLNTTWTLQFLVCILQSMLIAAFSVPMAHLYGEPHLLPIFWALAGGLFISGIKNIGVMYFQRDLHFHFEFILVTCTKVASFIVTIALAFALHSYWALVVGMVTSRLAEVLLSYLLHPYRPRFQLSAWRELVSFSKWVYFTNFLTFLGQRAPEFLIGKVCGPGPLGLFSVGYDIAMLPTTEMVAPINRAVFPGYAKMIKDPDQLREGYLSVIGVVALVALPAAVGIASTADVLIPLLLGSKWLGAVSIVQVLAIAGGFASLSSNAGAVYLSLGRPKVLTGIAGLGVCILLASILFFLGRFGALGVALAQLTTAMIMCVVWFAALIRTLRLDLWSLVIRIYRPVFGVTAMYLVVQLAMSVFVKSGGDSESIVRAAGLIITGGCVYLFSIALLWLVAGRPSGAETSVVTLMDEKVLGRLMTWRKRLKPNVEVSDKAA